MKKEYTSEYSIKSFVETTKSGIKLIYTPNKNNYTSTSFVISAGSCYKDNNSSLLYSNIISSSIKDSELFKFLLLNQITFSSTIDYTNTYYLFNSFSFSEEVILFFAKKLNALFPSQEMIDNFLLNINKKYQPISLLKKYLCDNLFISSPIKKANLLLPTEISNISLDDLRSFYFDAYKANNITIHISGPLSKKEIKKLFISLDESLSFFQGQDKYDFFSYEEPYLSINREFSSIPTKYDVDYFIYGIKLPSIEELISKFGPSVIDYLYLSKAVCFDYNNDFLLAVNNIDSEIVLSDIESNGKESFLYCVFKTTSSEKITKLVSDYSKNLQNRFSKEVFIDSKDYVFASLFDNLNHPNTFYRSMNYPYSKYIDYTKVIQLIKKVQYEELINFTSYISTLPKSYVVLKSSLLQK